MRTDEIEAQQNSVLAPYKDGVSSTDTPLFATIKDSICREIDRSLSAKAPVETIRALVAIRAAVRAGSIPAALRVVDRAWRLLSDDRIVAPVYGRVLCLDAKDPQAALALLRCASEFSPDPDIAALIVMSLMRLHQIDEARREFADALSHYCVEDGGLLSLIGEQVSRHPAIGAAGWIGLNARLQIVAHLGSPSGSTGLEISIEGERPFMQHVPGADGTAARLLVLNVPSGRGRRLVVRSRGVPLLGDGSTGARGFSVEGRANSRGRVVYGWARVGWSPGSPVKLRFEDSSGRRTEKSTRSFSQPSWQWPFRLDLDDVQLRGNVFHISAQLPDGNWQPLPDTPLLLEPAMLREVRKPRALGKWRSKARLPLAPSSQQKTRLIDVIIPVFRGREETLACIRSVLATIPRDARLVVIDDASDDHELVAALDALQASGRVQLVRNTSNEGFVRSANRGLALHPPRDVVLLNSDTLVFADWLDRLRAAAYSAPHVGTVTPLSNSGSIVSYPIAAGGPMDPRTAASLHALAATTLAGTRVELPVGVGFCMYLRRDCLRDVGSLDVEAFGKGYGEETDFCLRARLKGWSHQLAADVFVYHSGGVSFASRRHALLDRSQRLLNLRYPGFHRFIADFIARNPLHSTKRRLDAERLLAADHRFVLIVTLALPGGVDRYVTQRSHELRAKGLATLLLRPAAAGNSRRCELWTDALQVPHLQFEIPSEISNLMSLLRSLRLESIEVQHFLDLDPGLIDAVRALSQPYDIMIHDYSWVCPRVTFIDGTGQYCGEPTVDVCGGCIRRNGSLLGEAISVPALRKRSSEWLRGARRVNAPSNDTAARLVRYFPGLTVEVRRHSEDIEAPTVAKRNPRDVLRVGLIGAIGTHKGYRVLLACARDARRRKLQLEFVVIGHTELDAPLLATRKVFVTGRYSEQEATHLIQREEPDLVLLPSVWPETWCYTLDLALGTGLPVIAFDLGAIAERLRSTRLGELLPLSFSAPQINDRLLQLGIRNGRTDLTKSIVLAREAVPGTADDAKMSRIKDGGMPKMKSANGAKQGSLSKAANGFTAAQDPRPANARRISNDQIPMDPGKVRPDAHDGLSASVQVLPLPPGLYLFSVKSAAPASSLSAGQLALPAMHVGLGPGVRSEQVDFIAGPSTHGAWLFSAGDLLVTKISGTGVTLILTSVRTPHGDALSISVERLDGRTDLKLPVPSAPSARPVATGAPKGDVNGGIAEPASAKSLFSPGDPTLPLPVEIGAHIRTRGDMTFANEPWAGRVAPGLWIESFFIRPKDLFDVKDLEYKGLTGSGFETPWISDGKPCGTKGMATPLVGFAIRLKSGLKATGYDCEYSGYFQSGKVVGPLKNGAPCRSSVASDALEGIQLRIVKRVIASSSDAPTQASAKRAAPTLNRKSSRVAPTTRREPARRL